MDEILDAALEYAIEWQWEVFPAPPNKKQSYKSAARANGHRWGSTLNSNEIHADWAKWPKANIGIPTGNVNKFWVLEADTLDAHGVDGLAALAQLERLHGKLPKTLGVISPSKSPHYYFTTPTDGRIVKNSSSELGPGIDVRGEGGMVIAPPSVRDGQGSYLWVNRYLSPQKAPKWLLDLVCVKERGVANGQQSALEDYGEVEHNSLTAEELMAAAAAIPNTEHTTREWWVRIGMAFKGANTGEPGRLAWHAYSRKWPGGYNEGKTEE